MANAPIKKIKDYPLTVAIFEWNKDGKKSYSISLQRSYKKKDTGEYVNETINLYPEDLLKFQNLTSVAYNDILSRTQDKPSEQPASQPAAQQTPTSVTDDDIPF